MTKQEQIEEMAKAMEDFELQNTCECDIELAEHLYNKGYRKEKETAKDILSYLYEKMGNAALSDTELVMEVARFYGVEVGE